MIRLSEYVRAARQSPTALAHLQKDSLAYLEPLAPFDPDLPLASRVAAELNVDQTIAYAADQFEIAFNDSDVYRNQPDFASIDLGFLDSLLSPQLVGAIKDAVVDEVELHVLPDRVSSVLRGRDAASLSIDSSVFVTYLTGSSQAPPDQATGFPDLPAVPGVTVPLLLPGPWTAKRIAEDLCQRVGLTCAYGAPDYALREDVAVNGTVLSTIQGLVEPFSRFERSKVDIWLEGTTLVVRPRTEAGEGVTLDVHDTRVTSLIIRDRFLGFIRAVRLTGSRTGTGELLAVDPGDETTETTDEMLDPDDDQHVISRVVTRETRRILDGAVKHQVIETYKDVGDARGLAIVSSAETTSAWDDLQIVFPNQVVNSPRERSRTIITSAFDPDEGGLVLAHRTRVIHSYDPNGFLSAQETVEEDRDTSTNEWDVSSRETKQYRRNGLSMYQITTTQFGADGAPGATRRTTALGTPPGGPGRGFSSGGAQDGAPVTLGAIISTEPGARDVSIENPNLLLEHLRVILAQAQAASGATEHEVAFTAAGIPWIHRGQRLLLTGLFAEDGETAVSLQEAIVSEVKQEYRETTSNPTYLTHVKALWWTS